MSRSRSSRATRLVAAACSLALVAAACGGDDDVADEATTTVAEATTTTVAEATTTTVAEATTTTVAEPETTEPETTEPETTEPEPEPEITSIIDVATEAGDFTVLLAAVDAAGLTEELSTRDRTVLAPTDEAFETLGQDTIDALLADPEALRIVLLNHVLPFPQTAADIALFTNVLALGGASWDVDAGDPFMIGDATVIEADIEADNGIIHAIDTVLVVPEGDDAG